MVFQKLLVVPLKPSVASCFCNRTLTVAWHMATPNKDYVSEPPWQPEGPCHGDVKVSCPDQAGKGSAANQEEQCNPKCGPQTGGIGTTWVPIRPHHRPPTSERLGVGSSNLMFYQTFQVVPGRKP